MEAVTEAVHLIPHLIKSREKRMWIDYDEEADVLYISFERPPKIDDSVMEEDDVVVHYQGKKVVGVTILNASARKH